MKIKLSIDNAQSNYGIPVFVDVDNLIIDYSDGFRQLRHEREWSTSQLAQMVGVSRRTVEGWELGRMASTTALRLLAKIIEQSDKS